MVVENESAQEVVSGWIASEGHRRNMLKPHVTHIGIGVVISPNGKFIAFESKGTWGPIAATRPDISNIFRYSNPAAGGEQHFLSHFVFEKSVFERVHLLRISFVQQHPGDGLVAVLVALQPLEEQGGLAEARRSGDQRQLAPGLSLKSGGQLRTRDQLRTRLGGPQLGGHERVGDKWHLAHLRCLFYLRSALVCHPRRT